MLNEEINDEYYIKIKKEFQFLKQKFDLKPIEKHIWKFLRLRPSNFPTIRIAQFAMLIHKSNKLFSKILEFNNFDELFTFFNITASEYWDTHYTFGKESSEMKKNLGESTVNNIIINTIIPFLFTYGQLKMIDSYIEKSIDLAEKIKPENNSILDNWKNISIIPQNALESQSLLQLKNEYCIPEKCTQCQIGSILIKKY